MKMLNEEMEKLVEYAQHGFLKKKFLEEIVKKATDPYVHECGGYKAVVQGKHALCVSVLSLSAVTTVLSNKRKADKISRMEAKRKLLQASNRKAKRTPNTTRSDDGVIVRENLRHHDDNAAVEDQEKQEKRLEKKIKAATVVLTGWEALEQERQKTAELKQVPINNPLL